MDNHRTSSGLKQFFDKQQTSGLLEVEFVESESAVENNDFLLENNLAESKTEVSHDDKTLFTFGPKKRELLVHKRIENDLIYFYEKDFNPCKFLWDIKSSSYEKLHEESVAVYTGRKSRRLTF